MSRHIDLGDEVEFKVSYKGTDYMLREPTVKDVKVFQKKSKEAESNDDVDLFLDFVAGLGMPKDVAENLGLRKLRTLSEALLESAEKK